MFHLDAFEKGKRSVFIFSLTTILGGIHQVTFNPITFSALGPAGCVPLLRLRPPPTLPNLMLSKGLPSTILSPMLSTFEMGLQ